MDDADETTIRAALTDQLTRCEARCARCEAELKSVTAAMRQSDAANVALAAKLESARADATAAQGKLAELIAEVRAWTDWSDDSLEALCSKYEAGT
jgi:septal ring factor EnvC (AmiA/AmiB activator)